MLFQHSVAKGISLLGKSGMFVMRPLISKLSYYPPVVDNEDLKTLEKLKVLIMQSWTSLLGSRGCMKPFLQPDQH